MVRAGRRVTFAVTNAGRLPHEFTLTVPPGETRHLTWTFDEPGLVLYGCHVLGHWAAGMRGTIVVLAPDRPPPR
jgi:uncharacterized cupredoxin-like copper-binding protein